MTVIVSGCSASLSKQTSTPAHTRNIAPPTPRNPRETVNAAVQSALGHQVGILISLASSSGPDVSSLGLFDFPHGAGVLQVGVSDTPTPPPLGGGLLLTYSGDDAYLRAGTGLMALDGGRHFILLTPPAVEQFFSLAGSGEDAQLLAELGGSNPADVIDLLAALDSDVSTIGAVRIDDMAATRFRVRLSGSSSGQSTITSDLATHLSAPGCSVTAVVDASGLLRQVAIVLTSPARTIHYVLRVTDYGTTAKTPLPSPDDVATIPLDQVVAQGTLPSYPKK